MYSKLQQKRQLANSKIEDLDTFAVCWLKLAEGIKPNVTLRKYCPYRVDCSQLQVVTLANSQYLIS